jgi:hypothetical protein
VCHLISMSSTTSKYHQANPCTQGDGSHIIVVCHVQGPRSKPERLKFVLGTEAGMVTSIVRGVQKILKDAPAAPQSVSLARIAGIVWVLIFDWDAWGSSVRWPLAGLHVVNPPKPGLVHPRSR